MKSTPDTLLEEAIGDGNCAFNAFILGISTENLFTQLEANLTEQNKKLSQNKTLDQAYKLFIKTVADGLKIQLPKESKEPNANWNKIKMELISRKSSNKEELQKQLAPAMRNLAIDLIRDRTEEEKKAIPADELALRTHARQEHLNGTAAAISAEFNNYILQKGLSDKVNMEQVGDIFVRHQTIVDEFNKLYEKYKGYLQLEEAIALSKQLSPKEETKSEEQEDEEKLPNPLDRILEDLKEWWINEEGHTNFLNKMSQSAKHSGQRDRFAGDLELMPLAKCFGVDLEVVSPRFNKPQLINNNHGRLPLDDLKLTDSEIRELMSRNIVQHVIEVNDKKYIEFIPLTRDEVVKRLSSIPDEKIIVEQVSKATDSLTKITVPLEKLSKESKDELISRSLLAKSTNKWNVAVAGDILARIKEFNKKDEFLTQWDKYYVNCPKVSLQNQSATHWDNIITDKSIIEKSKNIPSDEELARRLQQEEADEIYARNMFFSDLNRARQDSTTDEKKHGKNTRKGF